MCLRFVMGLAAVATLGAQPCLKSESGCAEMVPVGGSKMLTVYRSRPLTAPDPEVRTVAIMIHGTKRDGDKYFQVLVESARRSGELPHTLLVAPQFRGNDGERCSDPLAADEIAWGCNSWKYGETALNDATDSYSVMDRLIRRLADRQRYPKLERVVVAGHSAGGQFVQRYAAGTDLAIPGVALRFVVANPSSYLYLVPERPAAVENCPTWNRYRYGVDDRRGYMSRPTAEVLRRNLVERDIRFLAGELDTEADDQLDQTCPAQAQGPNRRERARNFVTLHQLSDRLSIVAACGHNASCIYHSEAGRDALFGQPAPIRSGSGLE